MQQSIYVQPFLRSCTPNALWRTLFFTLLLVLSPIANAKDASFRTFESGQVRPLSLSPNGQWLFAVNTPASTLEIFRVDKRGLKLHSTVPVGLEPVAVAARNNKEVWVVNHLSDSVSIVRLADKRNRWGKAQNWGVENTLLVGDEPRDIVFAKPKGSVQKAYITTAHRGQNAPFDPQLTTPGVGRADVWVFNAPKARNSVALGGKPLNIINLFTDTPRALTVSKDGSKVYAAGFRTGNQTTIISGEVLPADMPLPEPTQNVDGVDQPPFIGLIVKFNGTNWVDELGREWDDLVNFSLPDKDVFVIDATRKTPEVSKVISPYAGVGTVLFNMAVHPRTGDVFVTNTDSNNAERFEGPGLLAGHSVRGNISESRISILGSNGSVTHRMLNKHIDRSNCCEALPNDTNATSLAMPTGITFNKRGDKLYVAALGSAKVGVYETSELLDDSFVPDQKDQIKLSGGGPTGLALDDKNRRLYVMTRFNNSISIIDTKSNRELNSIRLYNPEPKHIVDGRPFLYDAALTSSTGDIACASCHVFGDTDALAWDLGNPDASVKPIPGPFKATPQESGFDLPLDFSPLKGPMVTQSLRGLANHGPMHWRGDRTGGSNEASAQPNSGTFDEREAFRQFNEAFVGLHGRESEISDEQMNAFIDFALDITYPPNPIRNLDNSLTKQQQEGRDFYFGPISNGRFSCSGCHDLDREGNADFDVKHPGFFGSDGSYTFDFGPQIMKVPHFRNVYDRVGMFGMPAIARQRNDNPDGTNNFMGDQIRGFGYTHDGATDTMERFLSTGVFTESAANPTGFSADLELGIQERRNVEAFLFAYDSNLPPIVGQQVTLTSRNIYKSYKRALLLLQRANKKECDLSVVTADRYNQSYLYNGYNRFVRKSYYGYRSLGFGRILKQVLKNETRATFTCLPPKTGKIYVAAVK